MIGGLITAGRLAAAAVAGGDELIAATVRFGVRLALRSRAVDRDAANEMVELMRARAPQDSGRLVNGISAREDGDAMVVEATAVRPGQDYDYARAIEFGTEAGGVADAAYFDGPPGARRGHHGATEAQPFFFSSADEALEHRGTSLEAAVGQTASGEGL